MLILHNWVNFPFMLQRIKDSQLVVIVLILLGMLSFVLMIWEVIDPLYTVVRLLEKEVSVL